MGDMAEMYDYGDWGEDEDYPPRASVERVASLDEFAVVGPTHDEFGNEL